MCMRIDLTSGSRIRHTLITTTIGYHVFKLDNAWIPQQPSSYCCDHCIILLSLIVSVQQPPSTKLKPPDWTQRVPCQHGNVRRVHTVTSAALFTWHSTRNFNNFDTTWTCCVGSNGRQQPFQWRPKPPNDEMAGEDEDARKLLRRVFAERKHATWSEAELLIYYPM